MFIGLVSCCAFVLSAIAPYGAAKGQRATQGSSSHSVSDRHRSTDAQVPFAVAFSPTIPNSLRGRKALVSPAYRQGGVFSGAFGRIIQWETQSQGGVKRAKRENGRDIKNNGHFSDPRDLQDETDRSVLQDWQKETSNGWDLSVTEMAVDALSSVFYPNPEGRYLTAEKALKKSLRRYQRGQVQQEALTSYEEREATRKRLSELVFGTSVMRLRHFYVLLQRSGGSEAQAGNLGGVRHLEPIRGAEILCDFVDHCCDENKEDGLGDNFVGQDHSYSRRRDTVLQLVNLHAKYLSEKRVLDEQHDDHYHEINNVKSSQDGTIWPSDPALRISVFFSLPLYIAELLVKQYGVNDAEQLANIANEPGPITLRRNAIRCKSDEELCLRLIKDCGVHASPIINLRRSDLPADKLFHEVQSTSGSLPAPEGCLRLISGGPLEKDGGRRTSIWSMKAWVEGLFEVQDAGSQLIVEATEAEVGETILDYCAGNGGKTLALASRISTRYAARPPGKLCKSRIYAHDVAGDRLKQLCGSLERAGLWRRDAGADDMSFIDVKTTSNADADLIEMTADVVLVDAPCSSLGVLRRRPDQRWSITRDEVYNRLPSLQLEILQKAAAFVKPSGGRLVYATCSIAREENECVAKAFESLECFEDQWKRWDFHINERDNGGFSEDHFLKLLPHIHKSDGFFIARWIRR